MERSWTVTVTWALIFSLTASSSAWSWAGFTHGVSSSMVLLWRPRSLNKKTPQIQVNLQVLGIIQRERGICAVVKYQDVVLYPNIVSASAVIKCWPKSETSVGQKNCLIKIPRPSHSSDLICYRVLTWVLLHVVKPPLPVHLHLHLLTHLQRWTHKVDSFWSLPRHPQHRDILDQPVVIWLREDVT